MFSETFYDLMFIAGVACIIAGIIAVLMMISAGTLMCLDWAHQRYNRYKFSKTLTELKIGAGAKREALVKFEELSHTHFSTKVLEAKTVEEFFELPGEVIKPRAYDYGLIKFVITEHPDVRVFSVWIYYTDNAPRRRLNDAADYEAAYEWWQLLIEAIHYGVDCSDTAEYIRQQLCAYMREHGALV